MTWPFGHEVAKYWQNQRDDHQEETRWIGKPWRRIELLTTRSFYKGECVDTIRHFTVSLGCRRLGLHTQFSFTHQLGLDYSEEPNQ